MSNPKTSSLRKYFTPKHGLLLIVGLALIFLAFGYAGFSETISAVSMVSLFPLAVFGASRVLIYLLSNYRWKFFVDKLGKTTFWELFPIYMSGLIVDNLIPGPGFGGEPVKAYYLEKAIHKKISSCFATALLDSVVFSLAYTGFLIFSVAYAFLYIKIPVIRWGVGIIFLFIAIILAVLCYLYSRKGDAVFVDKMLGKAYHFKYFGFLKKKFPRFAHFKEKVREHFSEFMSTLKQLIAERKIFLLTILISVAIILIDILGTQFLLRGFGLQVRFLPLAVVLTISGFIGFYSSTPGGTGAAEASMIVLLKFIGISSGISAAVTLISRLSFYLITFGFGYVALLYVSLKYRN